MLESDVIPFQQKYLCFNSILLLEQYLYIPYPLQLSSSWSKKEA